MSNYILDGHIAVKEPDILKWGAWFEESSRRVDESFIDVGSEKVTVSTVFLGIDHSYDDGKPILFETMVFGGELDEEMERCSTWDEAEIMHQKMCEKVRGTHET